ncbi:recombinase family protein [Flavobacterium sp. XS1P27]|uniref:recombinase family protein n=1 Tax=Flavobacterium sp. XS1P27 TaxID=3401724 RepID=UPI003AB072E7
MDKIAIYARVSTVDKQDYQRQISDLTNLIISHGYKQEQIVEYSEKISGYKKDKDRPELTKLLNAVTNNPQLYKCIYVTEISRIGRDPKNTTFIVDTLTELGVPLYIQSISQSTIDVNGNKNIIVSIILKVLMEFAHLEAQTLKSRMKSGKIQAVVKNGKISGNNQAFGYMGDENKKLIINPLEAVVIEQIFEYYKEGNGTRVIANTLNQMNVPTRLATTHKDKVLTFSKTNIEKTGDTILWSGATIRQIIKNTIYMGQRKFKIKDAVKEEIDGKKVIKIPAEYAVFDSPIIIKKELFVECNELMKTKTHRNYLTSYDYLLKDLIRCGVCANKYFAKYSPDKGYDKVYKCTSYLKKGCSCGNLSLNISLFESVIYDVLLKSKLLLKHLDNPNDILRMVEADLKILNQLLKNDEALLKQKESELERLLDLYLSNSNYKKEMFENKETALSNEIESIKNKIILITKDIFSKTLSINNYNEHTATTEMIVNAKHNRPELRTIFKQFIGKIIINTLNKKYTLATVFIKVGGLEYKQTLKLLINAGGVRAVRYNSNKVYQYLDVVKMINDPVFKDNILMNDIDDILNEFESEIRYYTESVGIFGLPLVTIDKENYLYIKKEDI